MLIDEHSRSNLSEGRNWGLGFAFCKKEGDNYRTVMPISPCKDFLNDVVFSEHTGENFYIHGLSTSKQGIFDNGVAYVVMGIMNNRVLGTPHKDHEMLEKGLMAFKTTLEPVLSHFEVPLGIRHTTLEQIAPNRILATLGKEWVSSTPMVSLWSLLCRVGLKYTGGDVDKFCADIWDDDAFMIKPAVEKWKIMVGKGIPHPDWVTTKAKRVHNHGILSLQIS